MKIIKISNCSYCPYLTSDYKPYVTNGYKCSKINIELIDYPIIPDVCPLEDEDEERIKQYRYLLKNLRDIKGRINELNQDRKND